MDKSFIEFENQIRSIDWDNVIQLSEDAKSDSKKMATQIALNVVLEVVSRYHEYTNL